MLGRVGHLLERVERPSGAAAGGTRCSAARRARARAGRRSTARSIERPVGAVEVLQEAREVVQRDRARMRASRTSRGRRAIDISVSRSRTCSAPISGSVRSCSTRVVGERAEAELVRDQRVHAVDARRTPRSASTARRGGSVGEPGMPRITSFEVRRPMQLVEPLALEPPPVRAQRRHRRRVGDDRRRPVDGVDLRHQRRDDEPRLVVELVVGRARDASRAGGRRSRCARA